MGIDLIIFLAAGAIGIVVQGGANDVRPVPRRPEDEAGYQLPPRVNLRRQASVSNRR